MGLEVLYQGGIHHIQSTASTSWVITHNLNTLEPIVDCWINNAGSKTKILPLNVAATDANVCTITFSSAQSGEAFLT